MHATCARAFGFTPEGGTSVTLKIQNNKVQVRIITVISLALFLVNILTIVFNIIPVSGSPEEWSDPTQLTFNEGWDGITSFSGDGSKIAFESNVDGGYEIFVINSDGTGLTQLTNNTAEDLCNSISGDGSKIALWSAIDGDAEVFAINSDGTDLVQLTNNTAADDWHSISGDVPK
jgi:Tol biopolymer transport system component